MKGLNTIINPCGEERRHHSLLSRHRHGFFAITSFDIVVSHLDSLENVEFWNVVATSTGGSENNQPLVLVRLCHKHCY
jgi:hypothetical protein